MKRCKICGRTKILLEFDFNQKKSSKITYKNRCKECRRKQQNLRYKLHPRIHVYKKRPPGYWYVYAKRRREKAMALHGIGSGFLARYGLKVCLAVFGKWGMKCSDCGKTKDLTFHHLDGHGQNHEKEKRRYLMNNNPENLIVLCRHCHGKIEGRKSAIKMGKRLST